MKDLICIFFAFFVHLRYDGKYRRGVLQCSTICGAIDDRSISLKAIDERVFTKFCDKHAVFTHFRDKNAVFTHFCAKNHVIVQFGNV